MSIYTLEQALLDLFNDPSYTIQDALKDHPPSNTVISANKGKRYKLLYPRKYHILTDQHKANISKSLSGKPNGKKGKKYDNPNHGSAMNWLLIDPNGIQYNITNLAKFSRDNNLNKTHLRRVADGYRQHHKGWKCIRLPKQEIHSIIPE